MVILAAVIAAAGGCRAPAPGEQVMVERKQAAEQRAEDLAGLGEHVWLVAGAGDKSYDGAYRRCGTFGDAPVFTNGKRFLVYRVIGPDGLWMLTPGPDPSAMAYRARPAWYLPSDPWAVGNGKEPAPSVAEVAGR